MSTRKRAPNGAPYAFIIMARSYEGDDCLLWSYSVNGAGYANYQDVNAHTFVCPGEQTPERPQAAHECGVKLCMNPNHLVWSSQAENEIDKLIHGKRRGRPPVGPNIIPLSIMKQDRGKEMEEMKEPKIYEELDGRFTAWSTDTEAPHCYGTGSTPEFALMSYKLLWRVMK